MDEYIPTPLSLWYEGGHKSKGVKPTTPGLLSGSGVDERLSYLNQLLNPVSAMDQSMRASGRMFAPGRTGWERFGDLGAMLSGVAGVVAPAIAAGKTEPARALMEGLLGWSPARQAVGDTARAFVADESGAVPLPSILRNAPDEGGRGAIPSVVYSGGVGDLAAAAKDKGAWFTSDVGLAREYAGNSGNVRKAQITVRNPIEFRHAEQSRTIGDFISTALEGAKSPTQSQLDAARPFVDALRSRHGDVRKPLFEFWNTDPNVAGLLRSLGYDGISAAEKGNMKAQTWAVLSPDQINPVGFTAYHGSPHSFDKFSMDMIGTGEGAQAYGHGLYFAQNEDTARAYRDALSAGMNDSALRKIGVSDTDLRAMRQFTQSSVDPDIALRDWLGWVGKKETPELRAAFMQEWNGRDPGHMYQVQINADLADFLNWDAPLSEQPQKVQNALAKLKIKTGNRSGWVAVPENEYNAMLMAKYGTTDFSKIPREKWSEAQDLALRPVNGKYDPTGQRIVEDLAGGDANYSENATAALRAKGIPGISYLDAGSRGAGTGTRNYVVFDDALISILKKYGIAPAALGFGLLSQPDQAQAK